MSKILGFSAELDPLGFALRTVLVGVILFFMSKYLPRRSGGQFAGYDFAFFWMMGGLAASPLFDPKITFPNTIAAIVTIYLMHYLISYLVVKNRTLARVINGASVVLVEGGKVSRVNMRRALFPAEMLLSELRSMDAPNLSEVEYAVLETSGHVSVLKKSNHQPATPKDLNLPTMQAGLVILLINDGIVLHNNLAKLNLSEQWLSKELQKYGVVSFEDVYLASIDGSGQLYYSVKNQKLGGKICSVNRNE